MKHQQQRAHNVAIRLRTIVWNKRLFAYFSIILVLNFNHNWRVAGENTGRNFQYKSWQELTRNSDLFREVRNSDIFISTNQNDAFETNAGSFYANTGIRLAYLFNTNSVFPDFRKCALNSDCDLTGVRQKAISTLPNLTRGTYVPRKADITRIDDWVGINIREDALKNSTIWAFDMFLLTPTTYFSYLAPFLENEEQATINFSSLRVVTVTSNAKNEFVPAIAGICLVQAGNSENQGGLLMTEWKVPSSAYDPSGTSVIPREILDYREIQVGACAVK
jgi:cellulose synthase/poly-beta-1,6-N-acetylglucosamine synthase-like glycosyltransferase